ncbi:MAG: glycosyltransferase family 2 protein [Bacteroidales bacterium]|nr:glycosyltransferase family 2 protein [Bacteroidales bacterium]
MKTAVVILNWNTKDYLRQFLPPLLSSVSGLDAEVIVADSASTDGSMQMMAEEFPDIRRILLPENYGFTGGYNRALAQVDAEYFVLINSDIEVPSGWLGPLVDWMDTHPECGVCGPKLLSWYRRDTFEYAGAAGGLLDKLGYPFCRGRVMGKVEKDTGQYDSPADVMWVSGACLMVRSRLWKALGGLDDRFFAHMEEIDFCWRVQLEDFRVTVVPESRVYHIGGGTLPSTSPWKLKLNFRNDLLMMENNLARTYASRGCRHPFGRAARTLFLRRILDGCSALVYLLTGNIPYFKAVLAAHREFRSLRRRPDPETVRKQKAARLDGFCDFWMIPRAILGKL